MFTLLDVILIAILVFFTAIGFVWGFIRALGAIVSIIFGFWAAMNFSFYAANWLTPIFLGSTSSAKIVAWLIVFGLASTIVKILFWFVEKLFAIISIIPFLKSLNRLGGLILGLVGGTLILGLIVYILVTSGFEVGFLSWLDSALHQSKVANWLVWATQFLTVIFP